MARLADAYEARMVLDLDGDRRRSIAFVAASARQFIALAARLRRPEASTSRWMKTLSARISPRPSCSSSRNARRRVRGCEGHSGIRRIRSHPPRLDFGDRPVRRAAACRTSSALIWRPNVSSRQTLSATPRTSCSASCSRASYCSRKTGLVSPTRTASRRRSNASTMCDASPLTPGRKMRPLRRFTRYFGLPRTAPPCRIAASGGRHAARQRAGADARAPRRERRAMGRVASRRGRPMALCLGKSPPRHRYGLSRLWAIADYDFTDRVGEDHARRSEDRLHNHLGQDGAVPRADACSGRPGRTRSERAPSADWRPPRA